LSQTFQPLGKVEPNVAGLWVFCWWIGVLWFLGFIFVLWFVGFIFVLSQPFGSTFPKG
jgi:hypothetical protein